MTEFETYEKKEINKSDLYGLGTINGEEKFIPTGAIVFFVLLMVLCLVIWYGIYFIMLART